VVTHAVVVYDTWTTSHRFRIDITAISFAKDHSKGKRAQNNVSRFIYRARVFESTIPPPSTDGPATKKPFRRVRFRSTPPSVYDGARVRATTADVRRPHDASGFFAYTVRLLPKTVPTIIVYGPNDVLGLWRQSTVRIVRRASRTRRFRR